MKYCLSLGKHEENIVIVRGLLRRWKEVLLPPGKRKCRQKGKAGMSQALYPD